jgi:hypothetical protein
MAFPKEYYIYLLNKLKYNLRAGLAIIDTFFLFFHAPMGKRINKFSI